MNTHDLAGDDITSVVVVLPGERTRRATLMDARVRRPSESASWSVRFLVASVVASQAVEPTRYPMRNNSAFGHVLDNVHLRYEADRPISYCRVENLDDVADVAEVTACLVPDKPVEEWSP
jgi:hypothetical protein